MRSSCPWMAAACVVFCMQAGLAHRCAAQSSAPQSPPAPADQVKPVDTTPPNTAAPSDTAGDEPDEPIATTTVKRTPAEVLANAWQTLDDAIKSTKPQARIDAVTAVGTLSGFPQAEAMLRKAMADSDRDVRLSAVVASGTMQDRRLAFDLKKALDDKAPEVSYAAATALWKMHDHSGQKVLYGVLIGERKAGAGFVGQEMHEANRDLHSPSTLAMIGAEQGAGILLGPFSIGLDAARMVRKGTSSTSARVLTANLISDDRSDATKKQLISVLHDKDYFVRGAAARGLGNFHGKDVTDALLPLFDDKKPAVRFVTAAAYIRASRPSKLKPASASPKPASSH